MKKIHYHSIDDNIYVNFVDYKIEHQLKDFYKLLKKASGYIVQEYKVENSNTTAITNNLNSIRVAWNKEFGCHVYSNKNDKEELIEIIYKMLCYRYNSYSKYQELFDRHTNIELNEKYSSIEIDSSYNDSDNEIINDINELLSIGKIA